MRCWPRRIAAVLAPILDADAVLCSDSNTIYCGFATPAHLVPTSVNLSAGIRVIDHAFHNQNVNAYPSSLLDFADAAASAPGSTCAMPEEDPPR